MSSPAREGDDIDNSFFSDIMYAAKKGCCNTAAGSTTASVTAAGAGRGGLDDWGNSGYVEGKGRYAADLPAY